MCKLKLIGRISLISVLFALFVVVLLLPGISRAAYLEAESVEVLNGAPSTPQAVYPVNNQVITEGEITFRATVFSASDGSVQTGSEWDFSSLTSGVDDYQKIISEAGNTCTIESYTGDLERMDFEWSMRYEYIDPNGATMVTDWSDWAKFTVVVDDTEDALSGCNAGFGVLALAFSVIIISSIKSL